MTGSIGEEGDEQEETLLFSPVVGENFLGDLILLRDLCWVSLGFIFSLVELA
jgi:hypothetical protein